MGLVPQPQGQTGMPFSSHDLGKHMRSLLWDMGTFSTAPEHEPVKQSDIRDTARIKATTRENPASFQQVFMFLLLTQEEKKTISTQTVFYYSIFYFLLLLCPHVI